MRSHPALFTLLLLAFGLSGQAANTPPKDGWSEAVSGLRARLVFGERHTQSGEKISEVYLEFHNISDNGGLMEFDFVAGKSVRFELQTADGKPASKPAAMGGGNRCHGNLRVQLPMDGTLRFPVSCHSIVTGAKSARVIQLDPDDAIWEIPSTDTNEYFLSATLDIPEAPTAPSSFNWRWVGTIKIPAVKIAGTDPIEALLARLASSRGLWVNGEFPKLGLPATASPKEVVAQVFKMTGFDKGHVTTHRTLETRQVRIPVGLSDVIYTAVLVETDLGRKIVLLRYESPSVGWWSRVYDG